MAKFLGTDKFEMLPVIIGKMAAQMDSIENFISQLEKEHLELEDERLRLEKRINDSKV